MLFAPVGVNWITVTVAAAGDETIKSQSGAMLTTSDTAALKLNVCGLVNNICENCGLDNSF